MKILHLSQWYVPEPDIKVHLLAKDLVARGHSVTSITGFPNYPRGEIYPGYAIRWREWQTLDGVSVLRLPLYPDHSHSKIKRTMNYLSFAASAAALGPALCGSADVLWVYHPPLTVAFPAISISLARGIPFVYAIHDLWPETLAATNMVNSKAILKGVEFAAQIVYRCAAAIIVTSQGSKRNLVSKGVPPAKIYIVPNWADEEVYRPVPRDREFAKNFGLEGKFNVIYAGNLGAAQALRTVLDAAERTGKVMPSVQFVLIGDGVEREQLIRAALTRGLSNVRFIDQQPVKKMPDFYAWADALLIHLKRDPLFEITVPGKTTAYLACGRPIICGVEGDAAEMVTNSGGGYAFPPEDPDALVAAVERLYDMPIDQREAMGQCGRQTFLAKYTRSVLVDEYESILYDVVRKRGASSTV